MRFRNLRELVVLCDKEALTISQVMLQDQAAESGQSEAEIMAAMAEYYQIMKEAVRRGLTEEITSTSGLTGGDAKRVNEYRGSGEPAAGDIACQAMAYALAVSEVNASMGRIVATPTAGSCGIIPGCSSARRTFWLGG
ncbi:hypothetical protein HMSSN036_89930 [Paenibacillus macerans]|nr:hypothetical protein HMSSN036_89930 [Paenibacillus macerans]